jgi:two-component system chemotaxis response regulator CheB
VAGHDIIVIGASAGGVEALTSVVRQLPGDLPAALFVVLHIPAQSPSLLPGILGRAGSLPASHPRDGEPIQPGRIYVAPPDQHLLVEDERVRLTRGPRENRARPAVDVLFRTAARAYGPRVVGVVLTGGLDDGTAGLQAVKQQGGIAVVQDPQDALYPSMPKSALEHVAVDHCLPLSDIGARLVALALEPAPDVIYPASAMMEAESQHAEVVMEVFNHQELMPGQPSPFACPECHGVLWEMRDGQLLRYRCRVGHAYSAESMLAEHSETLEAALWAAMRALEESAALSERMAAMAQQHRRAQRETMYLGRAQERRQHAAVIRTILTQAHAAVSDTLEA